MASIASQIPKNLPFRYRIACKKISGKLTVGKSLNESYCIPDLGSLDDQSSFGDVRIGWSEGGLLIQVAVTGKTKSPVKPNSLNRSKYLAAFVFLAAVHSGSF